MVQFGHGYDQTPLEIKTGSRSSMRIGMGAAKQGLLRSRRAVPYVIPIKDIPAPVSTDQDWIERQKRKGKRALAKRESNGRKQPRFYDMDYSYGRIELSDRLLDMKPAPPPYSDTRWNYNVDQDPAAPPPETSDYGHKETPPPIPNPNQQDTCDDILHMGIAVTLPNTGDCPTNNDPSVPPHKDPTDPKPNDPVPVPGEDPEPPTPEEPQTFPYNPDDTNLESKDWVAKYQNQDGTYTIPNSSSTPITTSTVFTATDPATQWIKDFLVKVMGYGVEASSGQKSLEWYGLNRSDVQLRFTTDVYDRKLGGPFLQLQVQHTNVPASKRVWTGVWTGEKNEIPITNFSGPQPKPIELPPIIPPKEDPWKFPTPDPWKLPPPCIIM